ncbi:MAG: helix-turn-helix transcriptional regulator [Deltaproteobacteria bacterium]|nr:helix-turn-helix transcriptional regulator [Deltaproteobacteria bacterium]
MVNIGSQFNIRNNIYELRTEKKLTQQALADAVGVTRATINAMEKGAYNPSLELAFRLARFFEVDIHSIFFVEE